VIDKGETGEKKGEVVVSLGMKVCWGGDGDN